MSKTKKAVHKRIKVTKTGKILRRPQKQNHFNAKERGSKQLQKKGWETFGDGKKIVRKYLLHA